MKRKNGQKGITLIALIITIIILLILAVVAISAVTGDGILRHATNARTEYMDAQTNEKYALSQLEEFLTEYQTGVTVEQVTDTAPGVLEGTGIETDPYIINSIEDLVFFAYDVTNGNNYSGKIINLGLSLDFNSTKSYVEAYRTDYGEYGYNGELKTLLTSGEGFKTIGTINDFKDESGNHTTTNSFKGTFDGNNNTIGNLYINAARDYDITLGLFSFNYGTIQNLGLVNSEIKAEGVSTRLGGICGWSYGNIAQCYSTGNITCGGTKYVDAGGICCILSGEGSITKCGNLANIYTENNVEIGEAISGGIVAQLYSPAIIEECYNIGNVKANGKSVLTRASGIAMLRKSEIKNCYNLGKIEANSDKKLYVGGITGENSEENSIKYCYNLGEIKAVGEGILNVGGISGYSIYSDILNVYNLGDIILEKEGISADDRIGGITASNYDGSITNVYNLENIIINNYAGEIIGSIIGSGYTEHISLTNCNYLKNTYSVGIGNFTSEEVKELENLSDFPSVLDVVNVEEVFEDDFNNINKGYPILSWQ